MSVHKPVLLKETLEILDVKPGRRYIDATVGEGGHALAIVTAGGRVLGIDRDPEVLEEARKHLGGRAVLVQGNFCEINRIAKDSGFTGADGVLLDLGLSSWQLEKSGRGFTFQEDEPLDMRSDPNLSVTAADLLNGLTKHELEKLLRKFGEEKQAARLASALIRARALKPFRTTGDLVAVVGEAVGGRGERRIDPATKIFQALRIAVNDEVGNLRSVLPRAFEVLGAGRRLAVISFHSLEDREVKRFFGRVEKERLGVVITKKPVRPGSVEVKKNPRSRSAKLRSIEKR